MFQTSLGLGITVYPGISHVLLVKAWELLLRVLLPMHEVASIVVCVGNE